MREGEKKWRNTEKVDREKVDREKVDRERVDRDREWIKEAG